MEDDFGESLPSDSLFVPHRSPRNENRTRVNQNSAPAKQSFLKKGSRQEPSALVGLRKRYSNNGNISSHYEETVSELETSLISNSDLLSETTNSELHKKYLEDQRLAQMELAEFENIERQIDKFPVSPLLMSRDFKSETVKDQFQSRKFDEEDVNDEIINSEWSNKPAEYYMGQDTSSVESHEYHSEDENPESYNYAHHNQESHIDDDSDRDVSESENAFSSHENELEEAASMALVAESQFIRVSQSQNPFHPSNISQNSIDDSVSWGNAPQTAIRPRLSTESDHFNGTPVKSQISIAPTRYQTSHHSFGAIGEESDWDKKRISPKKRTVSPNHRSLSAGRKVVNNAPSVETSKSKIITDNDVLAKAKKLEEEIAVYQKENAQVKSLKRQQEAALAEIHEQRAQLKIWIEEEKRKTEKWCEDMKDSARKEKRAAAQYMRDVRNSTSGTSIRKEKAEIEALQATITKLNLEHNEVTKKLKANIARLQQSNKSQAELISQLENKVATLELEKLRLTIHETPKVNQKKGDPKQSDRSYAVEVNISEDKIQNTSRSSDVIVLAQNRGVGEKNPPTYSIKPPTHNYQASEQSASSFDEYDDNDETNFEDVEDSEKMPKTISSSEGIDGRSYDPHRYHSHHFGSTTTELLTPAAQEFQNTSKDQFDGSESRHSTSKSDTQNTNVLSSSHGKDRKVEIGPDGVKITKYSNGTIKYQYVDGSSEVRFTNGDIKTQNPKDSTLVYYYAQARTTHTTYSDGTEVYAFPTGQVEKHFPNGRKVVTFPDGTLKTIYPDGYQESRFPDGVVVKEYPGGKREIIEPKSSVKS